MRAALLEARHLHKGFPGVRALVDVSLTVHADEIVAVVGHNGSGKSTLVKILAGVYQADSGEVVTAAGTSKHGHHEGLHFIHQDLGLIPTLSTIENLDLSRPLGKRSVLPSPVRAERRRARELIGQFGVRLDVDAPVATLTPAERTIVAIARALDGWATPDNVLVLDEPTAALHGEEVGTLFAAVRRVVTAGAGAILISHRLDEVVELADRVVVLRDGHVVGTHARGEFDRSTLVRLIAGEVGNDGRTVAPAVELGPPRLSVSGLVGPRLDGVDLDVRAGEVVGVTGLLGSGMEQLAGTVFGAARRTTGSVAVDGRSLPAGRPAVAIDAGIGYVPSDRRRLGAIVTMTARENLTLPRLAPLRRLAHISTAAERDDADTWMDHVGVRPARSGGRLFGVFSGGNQQKIVIAKWLRIRPRVLLLEEPTQGVDVAAQASIHGLITRIAADGTAVVLVSTDTKELVSICHRVIVLHDGRVGAALAGPELTESALVRATIEPPTVHPATTACPKSEQ